MRDVFTPSRIIAVLLKRLGKGEQLITREEVESYPSWLPTTITWDDHAGRYITVSADTQQSTPPQPKGPDA